MSADGNLVHFARLKDRRASHSIHVLTQITVAHWQLIVEWRRLSSVIFGTLSQIFFEFLVEIILIVTVIVTIARV